MKLNTLMMLLEGEQPSPTGSIFGSVLMIAMFGIVFYFFLYRPQKKQEKETAEMRNSIELGDVIVTSGGIIGMVVKVKEDMLLIESSGNRTKLQIQKWAVHTILEKANEPEEIEKKDVKVSKDDKIKLKDDKKSK